MIFLAGLIILISGGFSVFIQRRTFLFSPLPYFIVCSMVFSLSTLFALNADDPADFEHIWLILLYFVSILFYSVVLFDYKRAAVTGHAWRSIPKMPPISEPAGKMLALFIISAAVSVIYYEFIVGYNLFIEMLRGSNIDYVARRLEAYSGNTGFAGIVNQFKNTILPITFFSLIFVFFRRGYRRIAALFAIIMTPFFLWAILGTGQRTFFFFSLAGFMTYLHLAQRLKARHIVIGAAVFVPIFAMQSVVLGRTESANFGEVLSQLGWRLFGSNQQATVVGFRYVSTLPVQYGAEWGRILLGFIPGFKGSDLSNQIHYVMFGSIRGTAPVSLWVSIYHNFGMIGVAPVMIILMKSIEKIGYVLLKLPKSELGMCAWGFFIFYVAIIPAANIFQIVNNGLPAILIIALIFWSDLRDYLRRFFIRRAAVRNKLRVSYPGEMLSK